MGTTYDKEVSEILADEDMNEQIKQLAIEAASLDHKKDKAKLQSQYENLDPTIHRLHLVTEPTTLNQAMKKMQYRLKKTPLIRPTPGVLSID